MFVFICLVMLALVACDRKIPAKTLPPFKVHSTEDLNGLLEILLDDDSQEEGYLAAEKLARLGEPACAPLVEALRTLLERPSNMQQNRRQFHRIALALSGLHRQGHFDRGELPVLFGGIEWVYYRPDGYPLVDIVLHELRLAPVDDREKDEMSEARFSEFILDLKSKVNQGR